MCIMMRIVVWLVMCIRILVKPLLAVKHQEVHAKGVESSDKNPSQHCKVGKSSTWQLAEMHSFNDAFFRIKAGKQWRTNQGE